MPEKLQAELRPKREAILDAARDLFAKKGYEETTIAEIAQVAGIAVGTVYLYFHNKHEILTGVALDLEASITEVFQNPALLDLPIEEMPRALIDAIFRSGCQKIDVISLLQVDMQSSKEILLHKQANERITSAIDTFFQHAIAQGKLAPFNTEMYAQLLNLLGSSILHQCFAVEKGEREEMYRQYTTELLERLFFGPSLQSGRSQDS